MRYSTRSRAMWRKVHLGDEYTNWQIWEFADRTGQGPDGVAHSVTYIQCS